MGIVSSGGGADGFAVGLGPAPKAGIHLVIAIEGGVGTERVQDAQRSMCGEATGQP